MFALITNRPEATEGALTSRPGRIDQAVEFPVPEQAGRRKLIELYAPNIGLEPKSIEKFRIPKIDCLTRTPLSNLDFGTLFHTEHP